MLRARHSHRQSNFGDFASKGYPCPRPGEVGGCRRHMLSQCSLATSLERDFDLYCSPFSFSGLLRLPRRALRPAAWAGGLSRANSLRRAARDRRAARGRTSGPRASAHRFRPNRRRASRRNARAASALAGRNPHVARDTGPETAEILVTASGFLGAVIEVESLYQASPRDFLAALVAQAGAARRALVVGHDPAVSELVASLVGGSHASNSYEGLPTGAMAMLRAVARDWSELGGDARVTLEGLWRPADHATKRCA